jgi:pyrroline-5-carboxylate reductase
MGHISDFTARRPLLLIGCGKMGSALLKGWLSAGLSPQAALIVDPAASPDVTRALPLANCFASIADLPGVLRPRFIIFAVKPQIMPGVLEDFRTRGDIRSSVLSIAAGTRIATIAATFGKNASIIRAMPNTPAAVSRGISGIFANKFADEDDKSLVANLMGACGAVVWLVDEGQIDYVTGVSGSGPAYVFLMVEAMCEGGISLGLDPDVAYKLARQTIIGAGALLEKSADDATILRRNVTSPKGTTEAALQVLMAEEGGLKDLMRRAIEAAALRGRALSS